MLFQKLSERLIRWRSLKSITVVMIIKTLLGKDGEFNSQRKGIFIKMFKKKLNKDWITRNLG